MVGFFNASSCPSRWVAANGSGGTPDLRGRFVREVGGNSGALGAVQEDAIRNITGEMNAAWEDFDGWGSQTTGVFSWKRLSTHGNEVEGGGYRGEVVWSFDASRVVPTARSGQ